MPPPCTPRPDLPAGVRGACLGAIIGMFAVVGAMAAPAGDPVRGAAVYAATCGACHSLDANRAGPAHRGVFGRRAGAVPGYAYSPALRKSRIIWNAIALERWLQEPRRLVPGTKMAFSLPDPQRRADVIAYLRRESSAGGRSGGEAGGRVD